jgi:hypothetical protein
VNLFDGYKKTSYDLVTQTIGGDAIWIPSDGSYPEGYTARVLINNPSGKQKLGGVEYNPTDWQIEYLNGYLPGLKEASDQGNEEISVNGVRYHVRAVYDKWDGDTNKAMLEIIP